MRKTVVKKQPFHYPPFVHSQGTSTRLGATSTHLGVYRWRFGNTHERGSKVFLQFVFDVETGVGRVYLCHSTWNDKGKLVQHRFQHQKRIVGILLTLFHECFQIFTDKHRGVSTLHQAVCLFLVNEQTAGSGTVVFLQPFSACPWEDSNLVDSASSHTLVSKIKPCMSKYKSFTLKLQMAHYISYSLFDSPLLLG